MQAQAVVLGKVALGLLHGVHLRDQPPAHMGGAFLYIRSVVLEHHDLLGPLQREVLAERLVQQGVGHAGVVLMDKAPVGLHKHAVAWLRPFGRARCAQQMAREDFFEQGLGFV